MLNLRERQEAAFWAEHCLQQYISLGGEITPEMETVMASLRLDFPPRLVLEEYQLNLQTGELVLTIKNAKGGDMLSPYEVPWGYERNNRRYRSTPFQLKAGETCEVWINFDPTLYNPEVGLDLTGFWYGDRFGVDILAA